MIGKVPNVPNEGLIESKRYSFRMFINQYGVITVGIVVVAAIGYSFLRKRK